MKKEINLKVLGSIAFVVVIAGGGATYWQYTAVSEAKGKIASIQSEIPSESELKKSLDDSNTKLIEYKEKVQHLEEGVPDIAYVPTLMKELEQVGIDLNIEVTGVRPTPESFMGAEDKDKNRDYDEIELEITIRGLYDDTKIYLDALEQFPKIIAVTRVDIKPERLMAGKGKDQIETKIYVKTYVFPFEFSTSLKDSDKSEESKDATVASIQVGAGS